MTLQPVALKMIADDCLQIRWSDSQTRQYKVLELRENCPCATCLEKHRQPASPPTGLPVITSAEAQPLRITRMEPMGRYAYAIHFSDGHDTGLYTLESLRELGTEVQSN